MKAIRLRTEYLDRPLGLGVIAPRFSLYFQGGKTQSAYRVICKRKNETVWDSGKVFSGNMTQIRYQGKALQSRDHIDWTVQLWDEEDREDECTASWFELGLLTKQDWTAEWISGDYKPNKKKRYPVDCFQKTFRGGKLQDAYR